MQSKSIKINFKDAIALLHNMFPDLTDNIMKDSL